MQQVLEFFRKLFDTSDWPPRWYCGEWTDFHGWFYIISDLLIWSAYFAIPLAILRYISRRTDAKFVQAYFLFAAFILACGSTHLLDAIAFWAPAYRLNALVRFITGVVSWVTVFYLIRILPDATKLRSYTELEHEIRTRENAERKLKTANEQLNLAQEIARTGHWQWDVAENRITWSRQLFKMYGLPAETENIRLEDYLSTVHPGDRELVNESINRAISSGEFAPFLHRVQLKDGTIRIMQSKGDVIHDSSGKVVRMVGTAQDITEQYNAQQQLVERTHQLEASNADLEKFAYIASHDLQEPLRKTMTFASLLRKESGPALSGRANLYIEKIEQSAGRMQRLIEDILQFSGLASGQEFGNADLNRIIQQVISDMEVRIQQAGARIITDDLPVIEANASQMGQLFQNLFSNSLKFAKEGVQPRITVKSRILAGHQVTDPLITGEKGFQIISNVLNWRRERFVRIEFQDNGIGFEREYAQKIFEIFQRLQGASAAGGTGIGLAICRKIVENHRGVIVADSTPGNGALFIILLPVSQKMFAGESGE